MSNNYTGIPVQPNHPMYGSYLKLARGDSRFIELCDVMKEYHARAPMAVKIREDEQTGDWIYFVEINEDLPSHLGAIVGEVIHALRSSLDLAACELVALNGGSRLESQFPVSQKSENFDNLCKKYLKGASEDAVEAVRLLQPFSDPGNNCLWDMHKLDIIDKHRVIIPACAAHVGVNPLSEGEGARMWAKIGVTEDFPDFPEIYLNVANPVYPLKDGSEIFTVKTDRLNDTVSKDRKFKFEVVFGETEVLAGQSVEATLKRFGAYASNALATIKDKCFAHIE